MDGITQAREPRPARPRWYRRAIRPVAPHKGRHQTEQGQSAESSLIHDQKRWGLDFMAAITCATGRTTSLLSCEVRLAAFHSSCIAPSHMGPH